MHQTIIDYVNGKKEKKREKETKGRHRETEAG